MAAVFKVVIKELPKKILNQCMALVKRHFRLLNLWTELSALFLKSLRRKIRKLKKKKRRLKKRRKRDLERFQRS